MKKSTPSLLNSNECVFFRYLSLFLLLFFAYCVVLGWLNQVTPVEFWTRRLAAPIALIASVASAVALCGIGKRVVPPLVGLLVLALLLYVSTLSLDFSWDGLAYHQRAVIALLKGADFLSVAEPTGDLWVDNYAKATWFYGATLVSWFGFPEVGASYHFVLGGAAASYLYFFCRWAGRGRILALLLAAIAFLNPVFIAQWFTYYSDAALGAFGILLFLATVLVVRENRLVDRVIFLVSAVLVVNVKASGVILAGAAFLYFGIAILVQTRSPLIAIKKVGAPFAAFLVLAVGVLGYSPYIQNLTHGRHIFYPLMGENSADIMTANSPYGFMQKNRINTLFLSVFSRSEDLLAATSTKTPTLKVPGRIYKGEIEEFWRVDVRIGGFGPLYSLAFILGLMSFLVLRLDWKVAGGLTFMVIVAVAVNPYSWWARYSPILWLFPIIPLIGMRGARFKLALLAPVLLVLAMAINIGMLIKNWLTVYPPLNAHVKHTAQSLQGEKLRVYQGPFASDMLLDRLGLHYEKVDRQYYENNKEKFSSLATGIEFEKR